MKNKLKALQSVVLANKPPKAKVSQEEFDRRLKNIEEWRKEHLAKLSSQNSR